MKQKQVEGGEKMITESSDKYKPWQFKKGQSGNPSGKPKGNPAVKELLKANSLEAAQKLIDLLDCGVPKIELSAAQEILNRTEGKPRENVEITR